MAQPQVAQRPRRIVPPAPGQRHSAPLADMQCSSSRPVLQQLRLNALNEFTRRSVLHQGSQAQGIARSVSCKETTKPAAIPHASEKPPRSSSSVQTTTHQSQPTHAADARGASRVPSTRRSRPKVAFSATLQFETPTAKRTSIFSDPTIEILSPIRSNGASPIAPSPIAERETDSSAQHPKDASAAADASAPAGCVPICNQTYIVGEVIPEETESDMPASVFPSTPKTSRIQFANIASPGCVSEHSMLGELADGEQTETDRGAESDSDNDNACGVDLLVSPFKFAKHANGPEHVAPLRFV